MPLAAGRVQQNTGTLPSNEITSVPGLYQGASAWSGHAGRAPLCAMLAYLDANDLHGEFNLQCLVSRHIPAPTSPCINRWDFGRYFSCNFGIIHASISVVYVSTKPGQLQS